MTMKNENVRMDVYIESIKAHLAEEDRRKSYIDRFIARVVKEENDYENI